MKRGEAIAGGLGLLVLAAVAAALLYAGATQLSEVLGQRSWLETSCEIERSWVTGPFGSSAAAEALPGREPSADGGFHFHTVYRYEAPVDPPTGSRSGTLFSLGDNGSEAATAYRLRDTYRPGEFHLCWVDPEDHGRAVLRRQTPGLPLGLLTGGLVLLLGALWGLSLLFRKARRRTVAGTVTPLSTGGGGDGIPWRLIFVIFFGVFLVFGLGMAVPIGGGALEAAGSRSWATTDCTILSSRVETHEGEDSDTYSVELVYAYDWDGRSYHGDRYGFAGGSSSGYQAKAEVVESLPPGAVTECRVDPEAPWRVVVKPSIFPGVLLVLLPLVFVLIGLGGLIVLALAAGGGVLSRFGRSSTPSVVTPSSSGRSFDGGPPVGASRRSRRAALGSRRAAAASSLATAPAPDASTPAPSLAGGRVLEPQTSARGKFWLAVIVALFWNGVTWGVAWAAMSDGGLDGCLTVFLGVFLLIGLGLLINVPYQFLAMFNPRPRLEIVGPLHPGARPTIHWSFEGKAERIEGLRLVLTGQEHATYRRGTDTHTARSRFARVVLVDLKSGPGAWLPEIGRGRRTLEIPGDAVPSFRASRNIVDWRLELQGDVPRWPDVLFSFPVEVEPAPAPEDDRPVRRARLRLVEGADVDGELEALPCEPGDRLAVMVSWDLPDTARGDVLEDLELRLAWSTSGRGDEDRETVWRQPVLEGAAPEGGLPSRGEALVEVDLPRAPYSFSGELISLRWVLELVAGFREIGESASRLELILAPGGREARLPALEDES